MPECLFCKIGNGETPSTVIYEDDDVMAFLDINPINKGHTLVIPKKHFEKVIDMDNDSLCTLFKHVSRLTKAIEKASHADGSNIGINNGGAAGQIINHAHVHIIPRFSSDGLKHWLGKKYAEGEEKTISTAIQKAIAGF